MPNEKRALRVVTAPAVGAVVSAPPVLSASDHTLDFTCGRCGTVLMHADDNQVHGVVIHCAACGAYNATEE